MGSTQQRVIGLAGLAIGLAVGPGMARGEQPAIAPAADGVGTTVQHQGNQYDIGGGTRSGDNLFHSFQRLGLSSQEIANFLATPDLRAIVGRVTGGDPSVIEGLIRVSGGRPDLFLMNPAGIVFGAGARLDVPGSFAATTATSLGFSNGGWFPAIGPVDFSALGGSLQALEFASDRPGSLVNLGTLTVPEGENLWLIGGGATVSTGTVQAPGGNVVVAAIPGTNRVRIAPNGSTLTLEVVVPQPGTIGGRSLAELLVGESSAGAARLVTNPDGSVSLRSADGLAVTPLPDRGAIVAGAIDTTSPTGRGGSITVTGDRVGLLGARLDASGPQGGGRVSLGGSDRGDGNIFGSIITLVDRHSQIAANATDMGPGGHIVVWADGVTWFGGAIAARGGPNGGDGGFAEVSGKQDLAMRGTADLSAPLGQMGTLLIDPRDILIAASPFAADDVQLFSNVPVGQAEGQILLNDTGFSTLPGAVDFTISEGRLESLQGSVNIVLVAERDILFENLPDDVLDLKTEASGSVRFRAGRDVRFSDTNDLLSTRGGAVTIQADGAVTIGPINTSGGAVTLSAASNLIANTITTAGGAINLFSTGDGISTGAIASGGGALSMVAPNNITIGSLTTQGGNANLTSSSGSITTGPIDSSGSQFGGFVSLNGSTGVTVN
ncbi:MAG TPA: filamentous hemagglutinin N-terminal domain-containing protein, partial [Coleofasciculaceae cyanobacterium]